MHDFSLSFYNGSFIPKHFCKNAQGSSSNQTANNIYFLERPPLHTAEGTTSGLCERHMDNPYLDHFPPEILIFGLQAQLSNAKLYDLLSDSDANEI